MKHRMRPAVHAAALGDRSSPAACCVDEKAVRLRAEPDRLTERRGAHRPSADADELCRRRTPDDATLGGRRGRGGRHRGGGRGGVGMRAGGRCLRTHLHALLLSGRLAHR